MPQVAEAAKRGRGRPTSKVAGLADDPAERDVLSAAIVDLERAVVAAVAAPDAGTLEGQQLLAGLEARLWTLRSLAVTDVATRAKCATQADLARTSIARLARSSRDTKIRQLIKQVDEQRVQAAGFGRGKA